MKLGPGFVWFSTIIECIRLVKVISLEEKRF